jgi:hypothetical protein
VDNGIFRDSFDAGLCPAGRQTRANISYSGFTLTNVDVTQWDEVWGRLTSFDAPTPWPGVPSSMPIILNFSKTYYMALHFPVPADSPINLFGWLTHTEYNYGQDLTASISTVCGDFNPVSSACHVEAVSGINLVPWRVNDVGGFCLLSQDTDYYLNLRITDPNRPSTTCAPGAPSCVIGTANNFHVP